MNFPDRRSNRQIKQLWVGATAGDQNESTYLLPPSNAVGKQAPAVPIDSSELLINIAHVGICGSDMHAYLGHDERRPPLDIGA